MLNKSINFAPMAPDAAKLRRLLKRQANMNIDELISSIEETELRENLGHWVCEWKKDESDINELYELVAKWLEMFGLKIKSSETNFGQTYSLSKKVQ